MPDTPSAQPLLPRWLAYALLVGVPLLGLVVVLRIGASLPLPDNSWSAAAARPAAGIADGAIVLRLGSFLAQIVVILLLARLLGLALRRIGQPAVVGEMLVGILLGPSVLGSVAPQVYAGLFPVGTVRFLAAGSQLGLLLFMFLAGLELRLDDLRGRGYTAILTSHASMATPLFLGGALALSLYPHFGVPGGGFAGFALFLGAAMSVTALPALTRILTERGLRDSQLGTLALACAALDDVSAWCLLAVVISAARAGSTAALALTLAGTAAFVALMVVVVRPRLGSLARRYCADGYVNQDILAAVVIIALASAWVTHWLGISAIFGAFLAGVVMPKSGTFVRGVAQPLESVLLVVLLPLLFATTGIRTSLALGSGAVTWGFLSLVLTVAIAGKLGASALAARVAGFTWHASFSLGVLMNTRGLMGLVIVQVALDAGVASPPLYALMVVMAIVTTAMTTPALSLLARRRSAVVPALRGGALATPRAPRRVAAPTPSRHGTK